MVSRHFFLWALLLGVPVIAEGEAPARPETIKGAVVRVVLFYSPYCPHCQNLISNGLPPIRQRFGERLQIASVNVMTENGQALYIATLDQFGVPQEGRGVPTLVVGSQVLVGSDEIPAKLPGIVERGLAAGGMDWPDVPLLKQALAQVRQPDAHVTAESAVASPALSAGDRFLLDPIGNSVSVIVLLIMVAVLVVVVGAMRGRGVWLRHLPGWAVPVLAILGVGVAAYLAFVELTGAHTVCGPVGDCNTVQQSDYARLLGVPVGILGVGGYLAMIVTWTVGALGQGRTGDRTWVAIWAMALLAMLFSIYLTFLEPFVIGATCAWCISSAVIVTLIVLVATPMAARILHQP